MRGRLKLFIGAAMVCSLICAGLLGVASAIDGILVQGREPLPGSFYFMASTVLGSIVAYGLTRR